MRKIFTLAVMLVMALTASAGLTLKTAAGAQECAYMEFVGFDPNYIYNAYVSSDNGTTWTQLDGELVRSYDTYARVDALGLKEGSYQLKVVGMKGSTVLEDHTLTSGDLTVTSYDRSGFAHAASSGWTEGVGAYNNDGTPKTGAKILYITKETAKTVTMDVTTDSKGNKTTFTGLQAIITGYQKGYETTPLIVRFIGLITADDMDRFDSSEEGIQIKGKSADWPMNMTFEGVGKDAMIRGFGILVRNTKSIEFRNFAIKTEMDDDLGFDTDNKNCWCHNLDLFYGPHLGGDHAKGDGSLDIKADSKYVTVSYCRFWDTGKSSMCGMKSETGPNYITYHHNWFDHSDSRHARVRTMSVHMYNNYYIWNSKYGVGATTGCSVFMESNYFDHCTHPMLISMQGTDAAGAGTFSSEDGGIIKAYGNQFVNSGSIIDYATSNTSFDCYTVTDKSATVPSSVKTLQGGTTYDNFDTNSNIMYSYTADAAADVPAKVTGDNGAGRLQHGDFTYTWTSTNEGSDFDQALADKLTNYTSSFVKIIGKVTSGGDDPGDTRAESKFTITSDAKVSMKPAETTKITYSDNAGTVTFVSDNTDAVTVDAEGNIKAVAVGNATIIVTDPGNTETKGKKAQVVVSVVGEIVGGNINIQCGTTPAGYYVDESNELKAYTYSSDLVKGQNLFFVNKGQHSVTIPDGYKITDVTLYAVNDDNNAAKGKITEIAGKSLSIDLGSRKGTALTTATEQGLSVTGTLTFTVTYKSAVKLALVAVKEGTAINDVNANVNANANKAGKYMKAGKLVIIKNGAEYNAAGARMK